MEYWIWSNDRRGWWRPAERGYTNLLHEAGRYSEHHAREIVAKCNYVVPDQDWPQEVMIPVTNDYLFAAGRQILKEFEETGDRKPLDVAYRAAQDQAILDSEDFRESYGQMLRGEGREINPNEFIQKAEDKERGTNEHW